MFIARGALFDLDGTLVDTEPIYFSAYRLAAESFGVAYTNDFHVEHLLGRNEKIGAEACVRLLSLPTTPAALLTLRDEHIEPAFASVSPCKGAPAAVAALLAALPGTLAVATSSKERLVGIKRGSPPIDSLLKSMSSIICSDSQAMIGRAGKPAPDIYHAAADAIGLPASECVAFEDSLAGIAAAAAAGCFVVAVPDPRLPRDAAKAAGAHLILDSLAEFKLEMVGLR